MHDNDPDLGPVGFLRAVMHDPQVDIHDRVRAAAALMEIEPHGPPKPSLTIQIQCMTDEDVRLASMWREWVAFQLEQQAYFNSLPKAEQHQLMHVIRGLERCNEQGVGDLKDMSVKGHG